MKQEDLFQDLPAEERAERLAMLSYKADFKSVRRPFDDDIKEQLKETIVENTHTILVQSADMKRIVKEFNDALKVNKETVKDASYTLKRGYSENEEKVFFVDDQENGLMHIYDSFGVHQESRKLLPNEKQSRLLSIATGTEG